MSSHLGAGFSCHSPTITSLLLLYIDSSAIRTPHCVYGYRVSISLYRFLWVSVGLSVSLQVSIGLCKSL